MVAVFCRKVVVDASKPAAGFALGVTLGNGMILQVKSQKVCWRISPVCGCDGHHNDFAGQHQQEKPEFAVIQVFQAGVRLVWKRLANQRGFS